jgi:hypothetical protein
VADAQGLYTAITLSRSERDQTVAALYDRLFETKRYIDSSKRVIKAHEDHVTCCANGVVAHEREVLAALKERRDGLMGALRKMGEQP